MKRITIVGLGLIGGSLGLALKRSKGADLELVGYARNPQKAAKACQLGAVDRSETSLPLSVKQADLVIIATPVMAIKDILAQLAECLPPNCLVTDTASTKSDVMGWAGELLPSSASFVGGHPMAGKEISGIEAAEATLFQGCTYCLTPGQNSSPQAMEAMADLVRQIGAHPLLIDASLHDYLVAGISHLPFLLSASLVGVTTTNPLWEQMSKLAATGYRDLTRLASQDPTMSRDICLTNQQNIVCWIDYVVAELNQFRHLVSQGGEELEKTLITLHKARQKWLEEKGYVKKA